MRPSIDFRWIKQNVPPTDAFDLLGIEMKRVRPGQWRGVCPGCHADEPRGTLVYTDGEGFKCHGCGEIGGDQIALARFVLDLPGMYEGAFELASLAGIPLKPNGTVRTTSKGTGTVRSTSTVPESEEGRPSRHAPSRPRGGGHQSPPPQPSPAASGFDPVKYAASLDYEHELLAEAGADLEKMRDVGIGFSKRGTHRGMIAIRVVDESGTEHFVGVEGTIHLPPTLRSNVVALPKRA